MHRRTVSIQVAPEDLKKVADIYIESVVPAAEQQARLSLRMPNPAGPSP